MLLLLHIDRSQVVRAAGEDASLEWASGHLPLGGGPGQILNLLERLYLSAGQGTPHCSSGGARGGGQREGDLGLFVPPAAPVV